MRKKVLSLVLSAWMLLSMVSNNVMADTTSQTDSSVAAGQTEEGKTVEAAEKAVMAFATLPKETWKDGKTSRMIVSAKSRDWCGAGSSAMKHIEPITGHT